MFLVPGDRPQRSGRMVGEQLGLAGRQGSGDGVRVSQSRRVGEELFGQVLLRRAGVHRRDPFDRARLLDQVDEAQIGDLPHDELGQSHEGCRIVERHGEELTDVRNEPDPLPRGFRLCLRLGLRADELGALFDQPLPVAEVAYRRQVDGRTRSHVHPR